MFGVRRGSRTLTARQIPTAMLYEEVQRLIDLVEGAAISELTLQTDGRRITIKKTVGGAVTGRDLVPTGEGHLPATAREPDVATAVAITQNRTIAAPMVGVFHHAEPPVGPGMRVEAGQVVGVIESMKLMNDVRADEAGVVREVFAEAGLAVEYGQPLLEVLADARDPEGQEPLSGI